jgi:hypothetical protein
MRSRSTLVLALPFGLAGCGAANVSAGAPTRTPERGTVDGDGRFSTTMRTGTYRALGHSPSFGDGAYACVADSEVTVTAGRTTHIDVVCPMR